MHIDANSKSLTKLLYIVCATIVIQTSMLNLYGRFITSGTALYKHFAEWDRLVQDYYSVSIFLTVLITIAAIAFFYQSRGVTSDGQSTVAGKGNNYAKNLGLGLGCGMLGFMLSLPLLTRGDPTARLGARLLSQSLGLSWSAILVLLIALLVLPVTIEIVVCRITFDTLAHHASVPVTIVASSLFFAFLWPIFNSTIATILGAISSLLYHRTRSLIAPIVACIVLTLSGISFALFQSLR